MWRSNTTCTPDEFSAELDRLWEQVKPLYLSLHAYVRNKLAEKYGDECGSTGRTHSRALAGQSCGRSNGEHLSAAWRPKDADPASI